MADKDTGPAGPDLDPARLALGLRCVMNCGDPDGEGGRARIKQVQVARETGIANADLSNLLNQAEPLPMRQAIRLMAWLRTSPDHFMRVPAQDPADPGQVAVA